MHILSISKVSYIHTTASHYQLPLTHAYHILNYYYYYCCLFSFLGYSISTWGSTSTEPSNLGRASIHLETPPFSWTSPQLFYTDNTSKLVWLNRLRVDGINLLYLRPNIPNHASQSPVRSTHVPAVDLVGQGRERMWWARLIGRMVQNWWQLSIFSFQWVNSVCLLWKGSI